MENTVWKYSIIVYILFLACILLATTPKISHADDNQAILMKAAGCKTGYFLIKDLAAQFQERTGYNLIAKRSGNKIGIKLLDAGSIDFTYTCKPLDLLVKKFKLEQERIKDWETMRIARDPIVILVNRTNPISNLTLKQAADLFTQKITNWQEIGGPDLEVKISYHDESVSSGHVTVFREITVGYTVKDGKKTLNPIATDVNRFPGPRKIGAFVAQNPGAIAFMGLNSFEKRYGKTVNINNVSPQLENIVNNNYPIAATYHLIYNVNNYEHVKPFLQFLTSKEGIDAINHSFVSDIEKIQ